MSLAVTSEIVLIGEMPEPSVPKPSLIKRVVDFVVTNARKLLDLKDQPHAIAGGIAIGMFMGFTPLFGLKTLLSLGVALALRCNPIAAVVTVSLHDVVTPIWPFLIYIEYNIGFWILSSPHTLPPEILHHHLHVADLMKWSSFQSLGLPVLVGSLFLSTPAAAISYFVMLTFFKRRQARRLAREASGE